MNQIIKVVQEIGNGGHIYLPKEMIGQKVKIILVEKTIEEIEEGILKILKPNLKHIKGIYLYGSYCRGEQTLESDIDILVITDGKVNIKTEVNEYDIISGSLERIESTIKNNAVIILPILKEARAILNKELIDKYKKEKLTKKNTRWYIETSESSLEINKEWIKEKDLKSKPALVYSLIMRLRGLNLIEYLVLNKKHSSKDITNYLIKNGITNEKAKQMYKMYREHREYKIISENSLNYDDISKLYDIVHKYFQKVLFIWEKLR